MARWLEAIQEFDFDIVHHKWRLNSDADALSRAPCEQCGQEPLHHLTSLVATTVIAVQLDDHIAQLQSKDPVLEPDIESKRKSIYPTIQHHTLESQCFLHQLLLRQNVLFCRLPSPTGQGLCDKLVVPKSLHVEVLKELHDGAVGGHLGSEKRNLRNAFTGLATIPRCRIGAIFVQFAL